MLDHHRLTVYQRSLDTLTACDRVAAQLPPGRARLRDQVERACGSVVANIAEGAGEFSSAEKARFYRMARRSAIEVAAWMDVIERRSEAAEGAIREAKGLLEEVIAMLVGLIKGKG